MLDRLPEMEPPDIDQPDSKVDAKMGEILQDPPHHDGIVARESTYP